jgi:class 3 adenylate cyclase
MLHPRLAAMASHLESTGWAAELCSPDWRLAWVSSQLRLLLGEEDDERLGIGRHIVETRFLADRDRFVTDESMHDWLRMNVPHMIGSTTGGREAIAEMVPDARGRAIVRELEPLVFPAWTSVLEWEPLGRVRYFGIRPRSQSGEDQGTIFLYGSSLPASLLALVARGNRAMFERMANLVEPGRHEAAVLFADLQASGALSRRLPSASYFRLLTALTTAIDGMIIGHGGIVGKHAGDGVTAYFLVEDVGSRSAAARAAIDAARDLCEATSAAAREAEVDLHLNVGLHWGGTLYMGQLVTDGRLEVTALGDEVNECARIQETARDGALLASKPLIERLDSDDARELGIDPAFVRYRALAELPDIGEKARRDAGGVAVTDVRAVVDALTEG